MSIWSKPVASITYDDIEKFCAQKLREGVNLDYKSEIPSKLDKTVAAFANTSGGMIVLGVEGDGNNQPKWPPVGMADFDNFTERITQSCGAKIYPPIAPNISHLIDNHHNPGTKLAIIRVDQSPDAPHAIDSGKRVYVRTGDVSDPIDFADIRRLDSRRRGMAAWNDMLIRHLDRFRHFTYSEGDAVTVCWSISRLFPSGPIRSLDDCVFEGYGAGKRGPDGAWGTRLHNVIRSTATGHISHSKNTEYVGIGTRGEFVRARRFWPVDESSCALSIVDLANITREFLGDAQCLFLQPLLHHPGLLRIEISFSGMRHARVVGFNHRGGDSVFPDDTFATQSCVAFDHFIASNFSRTSQPAIFKELLGEIAHAFDLPSLPIGL